LERQQTEFPGLRIMEVSADPYEQKLYQMFRSCETQCGLLDEKSLLKLCSLLELRDQGSALIASLGGSHQLGVSFGQFKEALLNFLGSEFDGNTSSGFIGEIAQRIDHAID